MKNERGALHLEVLCALPGRLRVRLERPVDCTPAVLVLPGVRECRFWQSLEHSYAERGFRVRLHFFHVTAFSGEPCPAEGQNLRWVTPDEAPELGFLPADAGVLEQLRAEGPPMA